MRKFVKKTCLFAFTVLFLLYVMDYCLSRHFDSSKSTTYGTLNEVVQGKADADLLVLGNSRAYRHFSPTIMDSVLGCKSYVLGLSGIAVDKHMALYNLYRHYYPKPKVVVYNVDISTIMTKTKFFEHRYFPYFWNPAVRKHIFPEEDFSFAQKFLPMYRYVKYGLFESLKDATLTVERGYCATERPFKFKGIQLKALKYDKNTLQSDRLDEFVQELMADSIKVVFVYGPYYYKTMSLVSVDPWGREYIDQIARKYDIPICDFSQDSIMLDSSYFFNYTHMNKLGSEVFSRKVSVAIDDVLKQNRMVCF